MRNSVEQRPGSPRESLPSPEDFLQEIVKRLDAGEPLPPLEIQKRIISALHPQLKAIARIPWDTIIRNLKLRRDNEFIAIRKDLPSSHQSLRIIKATVRQTIDSPLHLIVRNRVIHPPAYPPFSSVFPQNDPRIGVDQRGLKISYFSDPNVPYQVIQISTSQKMQFPGTSDPDYNYGFTHCVSLGLKIAADEEEINFSLFDETSIPQLNDSHFVPVHAQVAPLDNQGLPSTNLRVDGHKVRRVTGLSDWTITHYFGSHLWIGNNDAIQRAQIRRGQLPTTSSIPKLHPLRETALKEIITAAQQTMNLLLPKIKEDIKPLLSVD